MPPASGKPAGWFGVDLTVDGATARHLRECSSRARIGLKPHLVTVAVGPADAAGGVPLVSFARDLHVATDLLRRAGATVAISTPPLAERIREAPSRAFRRRVEEFNWAIGRGADRNGLRRADLGAPGVAVETTRREEDMFGAIRRSPPASTPPGRLIERAPRLFAGIIPPAADGAECLLAVRRGLESRESRASCCTDAMLRGAGRIQAATGTSPLNARRGPAVISRRSSRRTRMAYVG